MPEESIPPSPEAVLMPDMDTLQGAIRLERRLLVALGGHAQRRGRPGVDQVARARVRLHQRRHGVEQRAVAGGGGGGGGRLPTLFSFSSIFSTESNLRVSR